MSMLLIFIFVVLLVLFVFLAGYAIDRPWDHTDQACEEFDRIHTPPKRDPNWKPKRTNKDKDEI